MVKKEDISGPINDVSNPLMKLKLLKCYGFEKKILKILSEKVHCHILIHLENFFQILKLCHSKLDMVDKNVIGFEQDNTPNNNLYI
jgi:hypothetical protein